MRSRAEWPAGAERLYDRHQVAVVLDELAGTVATWLAGRAATLLVIMRGGMFPAVQLGSRIRTPLRFEYVHASRYSDSTIAADLQWHHWPAWIDDTRPVVVVDDIFDEGRTLEAVRARLGVGIEVRTVALVRKQHARGLARDWVDGFGLDVPDRYVFGCGMDYRGWWRQLPEVWALPPDGRHA